MTTTRKTAAQPRHTPGPWKYAGDGSQEVYERKGGFCICRVNHSPAFYDGVATANARLIAAAPDLIEALKSLVEISDDDRAECQNARAAIAKATGAA